MKGFNKSKKRKKRLFLKGFFLIVIIGLLLPQNLIIPVKGAGKQDYNAQSYWYYPWGKSITHKGVDIFANPGTDIVSAVPGMVVYQGKRGRGGSVVIVLGPKWRFHYYAHLQEITCSLFSWVSKGTTIGKVGNTGNAAHKSPHLHYTITTAIPYIWRVDGSRQGWLKMFYLNPIDYLEGENEVH